MFKLNILFVLKKEASKKGKISDKSHEVNFNLN